MMEAGLELDALVANKVMGLNILGIGPTFTECGESWSVSWDGRGPHQRPLYLRECICEEKEEYLPYVEVLGHCPGCLEGVIRYSEDISAAWRIVEKMQQLDAFVDIIAYEQGGYSCCIDREQPQGAGSSFWCGSVWNMKTAALAICLAALDAMESKEKYEKRNE